MSTNKKTIVATVTALPGGALDEPGMTISTPDPDREGDRVLPDGMDITKLLMNPVLTWAHSHDEVPIGTITLIERNFAGTKIRWRWLENDPLADRVSNAWRQGVVRAASIEFLSLERVRNDAGGYDHTKTELVAVSLVPVPCHPDAVRTLKRLGLLPDDETVLFELDDERMVRKAGRVLNSQNEQHLQRADAAILEAQSRVRSVLSSLPADDADTIDLTDDEEQIDVAPREVAAAVAAAIRDSVAGIVRRATAKAIDRARGRVVFDDPPADPSTRFRQGRRGQDDLDISPADVTLIVRGVVAEAVSDRQELTAMIFQQTEATLRKMRGRVD